MCLPAASVTGLCCMRELKQVWWFKVTTQLPYSFPFRGKVGMGARTMLALFLHLPPP